MTKRSLIFFALAFSASALALEVHFDKRTPQEIREWADRGCIREQMESLGAKICKALYEGQERERLHENFSIVLYPAPVRGGNPGFASGRRITWKVGEHPGGDGSGGMGLLCHEMTHVLDMGTDGVFTEAMADWVRNYKVWYRRCSDPAHVLNLRYKALRGGRHYGKYLSGANFIDFMTQNYGEGTIYRILMGYKRHGRNHWEKTFGRDFDGLLAEWRRMETIYDPVFQWTYNGTEAGAVRHDRKFCGLKSISAEDASDKSGAWLAGATSGKVNHLDDGNITLALHGRLPKRDRVAIASLGSVKDGGKAVLLATTSRSGVLAAHVIASLPGGGGQIVSSTPVPCSPSPVPHSVILTVKDGSAATVIVDGSPKAKIDMKAKCGARTFSPVFAVGGMSGGMGVSGFSEPSGDGGLSLDDMRVFTRAFRAKEAADYAATFGPGYRGGVAAKATWCGPQGGGDIDDPGNWACFNSYGEKVVAVPTKDTEVVVWFKALPSIPPNAKFACKSFTIDGLAVADEANIDLRGAGVVDVSDNTRLITRNGHLIAVSRLRGKRARLDGRLAVMTAMKLDGRLELKGGSAMRLPEDPAAAYVGELALAGDGNVFIRPGKIPAAGRTSRVLRVEKLPKDLSRISLRGIESPSDAEFRTSVDKRHLSVHRRR